MNAASRSTRRDVGSRQSRFHSAHFPLLASLVTLLLVHPTSADELPTTRVVRVTSSLDDSEQPSRLWVPDRASRSKTPLLVYLHSWSGDYRQNNSPWLAEAVRRGWIFLHPDFRGRNDHPEACGSELARQDVLDAIDHVSRKYRVDSRRVYLAGTSGGGHMAMLMAGWHPKRFSAVSAWVGISDLGAWYRFHVKDGEPQNYARMILSCLGGPPGTSKQLDRRYRDRSPLFHLARARDVPLDLNAGVLDGKTGSVRIHHTLWAWNVVARARKDSPITEAEIDQLWTNGRLGQPRAGEGETDPEYGRTVHLRRHSGKSRVTIFEGGHEGLAPAACAWLARQRRRTRK